MLKKWFSTLLQKLQGSVAGQSPGKDASHVLLGAAIYSVQHEQSSSTWTTAQAEAEMDVLQRQPGLTRRPPFSCFL